MASRTLLSADFPSKMIIAIISIGDDMPLNSTIQER